MKRILLSVIFVSIVSLCSPALAAKTIYQWAFTRLNYVRDEKSTQLKRYCDIIHKQALSAQQDQILINYFDLSKTCFELKKHGKVPQEFEKKFTDFQKTFNDYYISNYISFYNILFVNKNGDFVQSIRKEPYYMDNIFSGQLAKSTLSKNLKLNPQNEVFIDFEYYLPSAKPAAFFIEPVKIKDQHAGWIILQCSLNKINSLFAGDDQLGITGETFLVNQSGFLLTESSFVGDSTILKMKLDDHNIQSKFQEKIGNKFVTDYRGFKAITSFHVFEFLGTKWLVVAKVDQDQIVTDHFKQQNQYYFENIINDLSSNFPGLKTTSMDFKNDKKTLLVDMDEFVKADQQELLHTFGVSTCTAIIAAYPGKFGYMAHISPQDKVYGGNGTNILSNLIKKIDAYDIYEYQKQNVSFTIVANHLNSFKNIVNKLLDEGFLLSQINLLYYPQSKYANVTFDYSNNVIDVSWITADSKVCQTLCNENNLGQIVTKFLDN